MRSFDHCVISPVIMYHRCMRESWCAWFWLYVRSGIWPWYMALRDVRSICIVQLQSSGCAGVGGRIMVGWSEWRIGAVWISVGFVRYHDQSLSWM